MQDTTATLNLPFTQPQQAQRHATINDAYRLIDAHVHLTIINRTQMVDPQQASDTDAYILPPNASGPSWGRFPAPLYCSLTGWGLVRTSLNNRNARI